MYNAVPYVQITFLTEWIEASLMYALEREVEYTVSQEHN